MKCDICNSEDTYVKEHLHSSKIKNTKVEYFSKRRFCSNCNNLVYDETLDNEASLKGFREYSKIVGVEPERIIKLRKKYKLTQEQFSKIIGCAKKTLVSYEQGKSIPNDIYLITLKTLLDNPTIIKYLISSNLERYSSEEYQVITKRIEPVLDEEIAEFDPNEFNGYTEFSKNKLKNLILLLSEKGILKTKLLKEIFYCDFLAYKKLAKSITGLEYYKFKFGPVPSDYEKIINDLIKNNTIELNIKIENDYEYILINGKEQSDTSIFPENELAIIKQVIEVFKNYNSKKIVDFSHEEKAFLETNYNDKISYNYALDLNIGE